MGRLNMNLYLKQLKQRYFQTGRKGMSMILDEFCANTGLTRKHAISVLNGLPLALRDTPKSRQKYYEPAQLLGPLKEIWLATDQMCGKRLKAALPLWLPYYEQAHSLDSACRQKLLASVARMKFKKRISSGLVCHECWLPRNERNTQCCKSDEGGPLAIGMQVLIANYLKRL